MSRKSRRLALANRSSAPRALPPDPAAGLTASLVSGDRSRARRWLPIVGLVLLTCLCLAPVLRGMYIWDDDVWLLHNPVVLQPELFTDIWLHPSAAAPQYYPLVMTSFWLECRLWGMGFTGADGVLRGIGYHADNILLHLASALLIYQILKRLQLPGGTLGAWLSAAIFAIHPVNVESVAWVVERKNCLCGFFFFAALLFGLRFFRVTVDPPAPSSSGRIPRTGAWAGYRWRFYVFSLLLFIAAMLSKTIACVLGPVLLLLIWWRRGRISLREFVLSLPFFAIAVAMGAFTIMIEVGEAGSTGPEWNFTILQRVLIAGSDFWFYLGKLFLPGPVMQIYPRFDIVAGRTVENPWYYLAPVAFFLLVGGLFLLRRRISRGPVTAVLFFAGVLAPALGFINFYTMIFTFVADHYQYIACIGIIVLAVETLLWLLRQIAARVPAEKDRPAAETRGRFYRLTAGLLSGGILFPLGVLTLLSGNLYADAVHLWGYNLQYNPRSFAVLLALASAKLNTLPPDGRGAIDALNAAAYLNPTDWRAYEKLGIIYLRADRTEKAFSYLAKADALMPPPVRRQRAAALARKAGASGRTGLEGGRVSSGAHYQRGKGLQDLGHWDQAIAEYLLDLKEYPGNADAYCNIGICYIQKNQPDQAAKRLQQAIELDRSHAEAWFELGRAYSAMQRYDDARAAFLKAQALDPDLPARHPELLQLYQQRLQQAAPLPATQPGR